MTRSHVFVATIVAALALLVCLTATSARAEEAVAAVSVPANTRQIQEDRLALAQADPMKFVQMALENCQRQVRDYTCLFVKQELLQGKLTKEQYIRVKFREAPFAVFMRWEQNPSMVDRVLYVKGQYENKAMVKPAGILGYLVPTHVKREVNSPDGAKMSRRRLDQFGFANAMKLILEASERAQKAGELKFSYKCEGVLFGRKTWVFERTLPDRPEYPDQHLLVQIDQEWLVPVGMYCRDGMGRLLGKYEYREVKLNTGLSWKEFTPEANGL